VIENIRTRFGTQGDGTRTSPPAVRAGEYVFDAKSRLIMRTFYLPRLEDLTLLRGQIL
jgi:hypothetical protein